MTTLKEWREGKKWTQAHLANVLAKKLRQPAITQAHVSAWENGVMPAADIGEAIRTLSGGKVRGDSFGKPEQRADADRA
jgi:transcriptional regulator with XRE-family HTH domain